MSRSIALLRGVNVGGTGTAKMTALRALGEELGFTHVRTLLQSGNIAFDGAAEGHAALERRWEAAVDERLGVKTVFMIRSAQEWQALIAANPFAAEADADPSHLVLLVAKETVGPEAVDALREAIKGPEQVRAGERCAYAWYPDGIGTSKLTVKLIERHLGTPVTGRNWSTVLKLAAL